ncbi:MAG: Ppx/GppA family phosphatase [Rickettsiales bacterium]|jgi:exopolyphosphatase/guanosine-5'-triphosphate,3'-diphosphate pyrophosphatase|nr:Ppx/GppA family phosphatase [Rickettsiales bacterium]
MLESTQESRSNARDAQRAAGEAMYAALDLGTNNCRLLIAGLSARGASLKVFDSYSRIVRLGEGVSSSGVLSDEAMERTLLALTACQKKIAKYQLAGMRFVATEACRRAKNAKDFLARAERETGLAIEIITTEEEAQLAFKGCASLLKPAASRAVVFDIGGGSTELMWIDTASKAILDWISIDFGVMNLADKYGGSDFSDLAFDDMVSALAKRLSIFSDKNNITRHVAAGDVQLLSTSGTVTTLAAIHLDLPRYDRARIDGITLSAADIRATTRKLLAMRPSERFSHPCIGPDRSDFILSGCAIFDAISGLWPAQDITIADRGVREGIILSLIQA